MCDTNDLFDLYTKASRDTIIRRERDRVRGRERKGSWGRASSIITNQCLNLQYTAKQITVIFLRLSLVANNFQLANPAAHIWGLTGSHRDSQRIRSPAC